MNRGIARQRVFFSAGDGRDFEGLLAAGSLRFGVQVHAYCLMTNHFHLLLHCPDGGLSEFMQLVGARYTRGLNVRRGQDGPIFRGRFHSVLIGDERHLAAVGRYIHRNPLDIRPRVELGSYRWSSLRHYYAPEGRPSWLHLNVLLPPDGPAGYRQMVESHELVATPSVAWAIDTAMAELIDDDSPPGSYRRTVASAILEIGPGRLSTAIDRWLGPTSPSARRKARYRARQRYTDDPTLHAVVHRALDLLGAPKRPELCLTQFGTRGAGVSGPGGPR